MEKHYTILGSCFLVLGIMHLIGMLVVLTIFGFASGVLFTVGAQDPSVPEPVKWIPAGFGLFVCVLIAITGIPNLIAGYGLLKRTPWAELVALIVGILNLPSIPLGTAVGAYAIWLYATFRHQSRPVTI